MYEWLSKLQPQDPVAVSGNHWHPPKLTHVDRVTKTQIITKDGRRWRRNDGYEVGSSGYDRSYLVQWADKVAEEIERAELESWLISFARLVECKKIVVSMETLRTMRACGPTKGTDQ